MRFYMKKDFYKHIIFDWNGTLIDDVKVAYELCNKIFVEYGMKSISFDEYTKTFTFPIKDFFLNHGFNENKFDYQELISKFQERLIKRIDDLILFPDVYDILIFLKECKVGISILSAHEQNLLSRSVKKFGIDKYFDDIIGLDNNEAGSKSQNAINWFKSHNFKKEELLIIGDTVHDSEVAKILEIDCILVARGCQHKDTLLKTGYKVFDSLSEVLEYFKRVYYNL